MLSRRTSDECGFTLIELLVTITITSLIIFPLCAMVITFLTNSQTISARQYESKDQQIAAQYWSADVGSLGTRADSTFAAGDGINTGDCTPFTGSKIISLRWTSFTFTSTSPVVSAAPITVTYSYSGTRLMRTACMGGTPQPATIANNLVDPLNHVQCSVDGLNYTQCSSVSGNGANGLYLKFLVADASGKGDSYSATLVGERRQTP